MPPGGEEGVLRVARQAGGVGQSMGSLTLTYLKGCFRPSLISAYDTWF